MNKKAIELSMNTVIVAAISIIVLFVLVAIFRTQISNVARSFTGVSEESGRHAEEATQGLDQLFGCKEGDTKCKGDTTWICQDDEWVETQQTC